MLEKTANENIGIGQGRVRICVWQGRIAKEIKAGRHRSYDRTLKLKSCRSLKFKESWEK